MVNLYAKYKICNGTFMIFSPLQVIAVIRFECLDRVKTERASYITMLDYFMEKHRYGVFQTGFGGGVKDMYLVPLSYDDPVPLPIQPFSGPGKAKACLKYSITMLLHKIVQHGDIGRSFGLNTIQKIFLLWNNYKHVRTFNNAPVLILHLIRLRLAINYYVYCQLLYWQS